MLYAHLSRLSGWPALVPLPRFSKYSPIDLQKENTGVAPSSLLGHVEQ